MIYYFELRNRLLLLLISWLLMILVCFMYKDVLLFLFLKPGLSVRLPMTPSYFVFTSITEVFSVYIKITFFTSNIIITVLAVFHFISFCFPGLFIKEQKFIKKLFFLVLVLTLVSIVFLNFFFLPVSFNFFFSLQQSSGINLFFESKLDQYINFYILLFVSCFFNFQIIGLSVLLFDFFQFNLPFIRECRKIFYIIFVLSSTLVTPPDISSQLLLSFCMICFYEISIFFSVFKFYFKVHLTD